METDVLRQIKRFPNHLSWRSRVRQRLRVLSVPPAVRAAHVPLVLA